MKHSLAILDCDSTLCGIEGIDELAADSTPEVREAVAQATTDAMEGRIRLEEVFAQRMEALRPSRAQIERVAELYKQTLDPTAVGAIKELRAAGWEIMILSGGLLPAILPVAMDLKIHRVAAVDVYFDESGAYSDYERTFYTTRSGGKPECIRALKLAEPHWQRVIMVGDGVSDLETKPEVDLFVGYGGFAERPKVREEAGAWIMRFNELPRLLGIT